MMKIRRLFCNYFASILGSRLQVRRLVEQTKIRRKSVEKKKEPRFQHFSSLSTLFS